MATTLSRAAGLQRGCRTDPRGRSVDFAEARLNPNASSIAGVVCGVGVGATDDPLMQKIRYLDKLVDELARGKPMGTVLRA
jgi:hypothetical protein